MFDDPMNSPCSVHHYNSPGIRTQCRFLLSILATVTTVPPIISVSVCRTVCLSLPSLSLLSLLLLNFILFNVFMFSVQSSSDWFSYVDVVYPSVQSVTADKFRSHSCKAPNVCYLPLHSHRSPAVVSLPVLTTYP